MFPATTQNHLLRLAAPTTRTTLKFPTKARHSIHSNHRPLPTPTPRSVFVHTRPTALRHQTSRSPPAQTSPSSSNPPAATMSTEDRTIYTLTFYTPPSHTASILSAIHGSTSAGTWPNPSSSSTSPTEPPKYTSTAFITRGTGQFQPSATANPHIGTPGALEVVAEDKVEMIVVGRDTVAQAVQKLREAHPYEVVAFFVVKCEDFF